MMDSLKKQYLAQVTDKYVKGEIGRRSFLRNAAKLGLGVGALAYGMTGRPFLKTALASDLKPSSDVMSWLRDCCKLCEMLSMSFVTRLSKSPRDCLSM